MEINIKRITINKDKIKWVIEYDSDSDVLFGQGIYVPCDIMHTSCRYQFTRLARDSSEMIFKLFNEYSNGTLDTNKYTIIFPKYSDIQLYFLIKSKNGDDMELFCRKEYLSDAEKRLALIVYDHAFTTQVFMKQINTMNEEIVKLNDKFVMLTDFIDTPTNNHSENMLIIKEIIKLH